MAVEEVCQSDSGCIEYREARKQNATANKFHVIECA